MGDVRSSARSSAKWMLLLALVGFALMITPMRSDSLVPIGTTSTGVLVWTGDNPATNLSDRFQGFLFNTAPSQGTARITVNDQTDLLQLEELPQVTLGDGERRLWISSGRVASRSIVRESQTLTVQIELQPVPAEPVSVAIRYAKGRNPFHR